MKSFLRILFLFFLVTQICFAQWYQQNSGTTAILNSVHFEDANNGWAAGDSGTILHTTNGGQNWITQTSGTNTYLRKIYFIDLSNGWVVGEGGIILRTTNSGNTWIPQNSGTTNDLIAVDFIDVTNGWVVGYWTMLKTTNGGASWVTQSTGTNNELFAIDFSDLDIGWTVGQYSILKTTDRGINWTNYLPGGDTWYFSSIYFTNSTNGWISGYIPGCQSCGGVIHTTDGGLNWNYQLNGIPILSITILEENKGWAVGLEYIHENGLNDVYPTIRNTTDGGVNWSRQIYDSTATTDSTATILLDISFTDLNSGWIVGSDGIILHTTNGGVVPVELTAFDAQAENQKVILRWTTSTELNNNGFEIQRKVAESDFATVGSVRGEGTTTNQTQYSYVDKDLVDGKYFYRLKQVDYNGTYEYSDIIEVDVRSLNEYALEQNYPNPFNPITTIGYVLKEKTMAKIILLNAIGEEINVLVNEEQDKGFHKVDFNATDLPSGVYFYRLQAGNYVQTRKMILLK